MSHSESIVFAVAVVILVVALSAFARRLPVPTPILQLAAGFGVALIPGIGWSVRATAVNAPFS